MGVSTDVLFYTSSQLLVFADAFDAFLVSRMVSHTRNSKSQTLSGLWTL